MESQHDLDYLELEQRNQQLSREVEEITLQFEILKKQFADSMKKNTKDNDKSDKKLSKKRNFQPIDNSNSVDEHSSSSDSESSNSDKGGRNNKEIKHFAKKIKLPEYSGDVGSGEEAE
ncbi:hypothetical protein KI387_020698, partial [Taxus chinensis]